MATEDIGGPVSAADLATLRSWLRPLARQQAAPASDTTARDEPKASEPDTSTRTTGEAGA